MILKTTKSLLSNGFLNRRLWKGSIAKALIILIATISMNVLFLGCKGNEVKTSIDKPVTAHPVQIHIDTLTAKVKMGESFKTIVRSFDLSEGESNRLLTGIKENFVFRLYAGQVYRLISQTQNSTHTVREFVIEDRFSECKHTLIEQPQTGSDSTSTHTDAIIKPFVYLKMEIPIRIDTVPVSGSLATNLYEAFLSRGETPALIQLVTKIFAWDIDFYKDPRVGDTYNLLVEKRYGEEGAFRGYGKVLSAKYINRGKEYFGILYKGSYFDQNGVSLEKMLLKVPLPFARISSGFSGHRLHPILGVNRPHWGVDYAAPKGTTIFAAGDGIIEYAKWVNGYGKTIKIRHNGVYNTYYAHLNGFVAGMCVGRRVHQGEVIAFLGMTGLATGPHLDYRVECHGQYINPASLKMEAKEGVAKAEWKEFCDQRDFLLTKMVLFEETHLASAF